MPLWTKRSPLWTRWMPISPTNGSITFRTPLSGSLSDSIELFAKKNSKKNNYSEKSLSKKIEHINERITEYFTALDETACKSCPHKAKCFKQGQRYKYRKICKDKYFQSLVRAKALFEENKQLYRRRQELNEHVFGSIKRQLGFPQLNVRTKQKVSGEVSLLFLGYNLKRAINIVGKSELIR